MKYNHKKKKVVEEERGQVLLAEGGSYGVFVLKSERRKRPGRGDQIWLKEH